MQKLNNKVAILIPGNGMYFASSKKINGKVHPFRRKIYEDVNRLGYLCEYIKNEKMFRTNYARVGCFITAGARSYISKLMQPIQDRIVRIHTDGFITNGQCDFELTDELGGLKNDKKGKCNIKNSMVIEWN